MAILIVEDEKELAELIKEELNEAGFKEIEISYNGQDAFNKCVGRIDKLPGFELIISDWDMPVMNGLQLLERIRRNTHLAETPFILITGVGTSETVKMASRHGVSALLLKPYDKGNLIEKIRLLMPAKTDKASGSAAP